MPSWKISVAAPRSMPPVSAVWVLVATQPMSPPSWKIGLMIIMS